MSRKLRTSTIVGAIAVAGLVMAACSSSSTPTATTSKAPPTTAAVSVSSLENWPTQSVSLQETGSSLLYPLFNLWVAQVKTQWPSVTVTTGSTGSGTGVADAANGTVNIGASDAYLSTAQVTADPGIENVPLAISGQMVAYNVPNVTGHIKLTGPVVAAIYQGTITNWNDAKIAALNPGVTLPNLPIITVHRSDSSGDTFLFTSFLTASDPSGWTISPDTTVQWPTVTGAQGAMGNGGMVTACKANPGCIAYIGISYQSEALGDGLNYAALKNEAGNYELPTQDTFSAEASGYASSTPASGAVSMIFGSNSNGYPIVNYEYGIVPTKQPSALDAQAVKALLAWAIDPSGGNAPSFLDQVGFVALPPAVVNISTALLSKVSS